MAKAQVECFYDCKDGWLPLECGEIPCNLHQPALVGGFSSEDPAMTESEVECRYDWEYDDLFDEEPVMGNDEVECPYGCEEGWLPLETGAVPCSLHQPAPTGDFFSEEEPPEQNSGPNGPPLSAHCQVEQSGIPSYETHAELFEEILRGRPGAGDELARKVAENRIDLIKGRGMTVVENFDWISTAVVEYMIATGLQDVHVRKPEFIQYVDGSIQNHAEQGYGEDFIYLASCTFGGGVYYSLRSRIGGGPTLVDIYESFLGDQLSVKTAKKLAAHVSESKRAEELRFLESEYLENFIPPAPANEFRGYFDHSFYHRHFYNLGLRYSETHTPGRLAQALGLMSLYYPEITFDMPPLGHWVPENELPDIELLERLKFLAFVKPLIQERTVIPVNIKTGSGVLIEYWLDYLGWYLDNYEARYLDLAREYYGDLEGCSAVEFIEVYLRHYLESSICQAHNVYTDDLFFLFTQFLAEDGRFPGVMFDGCNPRSIRLLDKLILPTLDECELSDIIALRRNGKQLSLFRESLSKILELIVQESDGSSKSPEKLPLLAKELLGSRADALKRDLRSSSLSNQVKKSGFTFSVGALVSYALGGHPLTSFTAGAISELLTAGLRLTKDSRGRKACGASARLYTKLASADIEDSTD